MKRKGPPLDAEVLFALFWRFMLPLCDDVITGEYMDSRTIRIGETGMEQLAQWLKQTGQPQSLEAVTEHYLLILKQLVGVQENEQ